MIGRYELCYWTETGPEPEHAGGIISHLGEQIILLPLWATPGWTLGLILSEDGRWEEKLEVSLRATDYTFTLFSLVNLLNLEFNPDGLQISVHVLSMDNLFHYLFTFLFSCVCVSVLSHWVFTAKPFHVQNRFSRLIKRLCSDLQRRRETDWNTRFTPREHGRLNVEIFQSEPNWPTTTSSSETRCYTAKDTSERHLSALSNCSAQQSDGSVC